MKVFISGAACLKVRSAATVTGQQRQMAISIFLNRCQLRVDVAKSMKKKVSECLAVRYVQWQ